MKIFSTLASGVPYAGVGVIFEERLNFRGAVGSPGLGVIPTSDLLPDTNGTVGPNHIVEISAYTVFT